MDKSAVLQSTAHLDFHCLTEKGKRKKTERVEKQLKLLPDLTLTCSVWRWSYLEERERASKRVRECEEKKKKEEGHEKEGVSALTQRRAARKVCGKRDVHGREQSARMARG